MFRHTFFVPAACLFFIGSISQALDVSGASNHWIIDSMARPISGKILRPRVLVVVSFEIGEVIGAKPGEAQFWIERKHLTRKYIIPGGFSPLYCNQNQTLCLSITGMGTANATASVMALGFHPNLDLRETYIIVTAIGGGLPDNTTLGSAAWAEWVVDMDISHHIDARDLPTGWEFDQFHLGCREPWCSNGITTGTEIHRLNSRLTGWAFELSKDTKLLDSDEVQGYRNRYPTPAAKQSPSVLKCDTVSGAFYHGAHLSTWARWWFNHWTGQQGSLCTAAMEDSGIMTAIERLAGAKKVSADRALVLRAIANFDQAYPGQSELDSLSFENGGVALALENVFRVGSRITDEIIRRWPQYKKNPPGNYKN